MGQNPDVDNAYAMSSPDEVQALYRDWSHSYDTAFSDGQGYQLPREVALAYLGAGGIGPVLDVGAGTGLVGTVLRSLQIAPIDGIDLSQEMLDVAQVKGDYRSLYRYDVTTPITLLDGPYAGIVSAGTFTLGHVGPVALQNLLAVAAANALFVISVNAEHFVSAGFDTALAGLADQITAPNYRDVRIYDDRADAEHRNDMARLVTFRKH